MKCFFEDLFYMIKAATCIGVSSVLLLFMIAGSIVALEKVFNLSIFN